MSAISPNDLATLRSLASRGDKMAGVVMRAFDALRAADKEQHIARCGTTANLAALEDLLELDGVTLVAGDLVLVKNQTEEKDNGVYVASASAWTRLKDDAGADVLRPGMLVSVREGDTLADTLWSCTSDATVIGTDDIIFGQMIDAVAPGSITTEMLEAGILSADADGRALFAAGVLNAATFASAVADLAVTAAKLAAAVQIKIAGISTIAVGAPVGDVITATITLKDITGTALAAAAKATIWVSDTAGAAPSAVAPDGGTAITTGVLLKAHTAGVLLEAVSDATGVIAVALTESGTKNYYVNVAFGNVVISSAVLAFA